MNKRIGVFIGEIAQDYQKIVAQNAVKRANSLGYDVVFICSYGSYIEDFLYAEGEKNGMNLPDCSKFDGIIITEDVFDIEGMPDELYNLVRKTAKCPVVYLRSTREGCYSVLPENTQPIEEAVRHFTDVHGFTDICYMSGKKGSEDAKERLAGYLNVMKEKNIPVTDDMIFHGDYWREKGKEAIDWFMQDRDTYPQAIVCANDYMALSLVYELSARGVRVPEDVCITGFDYLDEAKLCIPSLSTFEVDFEGMVVRAVDIIDNVNKGKEEEPVQRINAKFRLHNSCGCGCQYQYDRSVNFLEINQRHVDDTKHVLMSVSEYQYAYEFDEYMAIADVFRNQIRSPKVYFCFDDPEETEKDGVENDCLFTEHMILKRIFDGNKPAQKLNTTFPRWKILPDECWSETEYNNFCVFSIHFKNIVYGYMVAKMPEEGWFDIYTQGYIMMLANAIQNGEVHEKMENLESIRAIYQNDALTGILNRRGFDKQFQEKYNAAKIDGTHLGIISIDMDNLKVINDTLGHAEGDEALVTMANALNSAMKEGDICARIGGDEFAAVINVTHPDRIKEFRRELKNTLKNSKPVGGKYQVDASVGICENTEFQASSMVACIQIADKRMYEEKRNKKNGNVR